MLPKNSYLWILFPLHSIILNYNYFVYISVDNGMIFFKFEFNGVWGGSLFFKNGNICKRVVLSLRTSTRKGKGCSKEPRQLLENLKKRKLHSPFIHDMWGADLANMQLISKCNKGIHFLLCVIDIFSKNAWLIPLKDKKSYYNYQCFPKNLG